VESHRDNHQVATEPPVRTQGTFARIVDGARAGAGVFLITIASALLLRAFVIEAFRIPSASMEGTLLVGDCIIVNKVSYGVRSPKHVPFTTASIPFLKLPGFKTPQRGDVIVFEHPDGTVNFVKRCIALAGDTVTIRRGNVFVNGRQLIVPTTQRSDADRDNYGPVVVPRKGDLIPLSLDNISRWERFIRREGHRVDVDERGTIHIDGVRCTSYTVERDYVFVLGDNRGNSLDSRSWGFLPEDNIIGEAMLVYWSLDEQNHVRWNRIGTIIQ